MNHSSPYDTQGSEVGRYPPRPDLEMAFQSVRRAKIPQIPDAVLGLREELTRPEPRLKVAAELISQDLAMTGQVLKTINSPLLRCRTNISSVQQAVAMLGIKRLTNLVTAESIRRMLGVTEGPARVIWESIMEQAHAMVAVAEATHDCTPDEAYLFGMMQDVGSLIFAELLPEYGSEWVLRGAADPLSLLDYERSALGVDHTTVGFLLAGTWRLPEPVALAIYHHHDPGCGSLEDPTVRVLVALSKLAHYLIALTHGGQEPPEILDDRDTAMQELRIADADWEHLCAQATGAGWTQPGVQ